MINLGKKFLTLFFVVVLFIVVAGYVIATWTSRPTFHSADDIKITISGIDYSLQEAIQVYYLVVLL